MSSRQLVNIYRNHYPEAKDGQIEITLTRNSDQDISHDSQNRSHNAMI